MMQIRIPVPIATGLIVVAFALANVAGVAAQPTQPPAASTTGRPFKVLRGVMNQFGTFVAGGAGITVTVITVGDYQISFPVGTWTNPRTGNSCGFVPQAQAVVANAPATFASWNAPADGSGMVELLVGNNATVGMVFMSASV